MNILEARDAFLATVNNIAEDAVRVGLGAEVKCYLTDIDLVPVRDDAKNAALIAAEISLSANGVEERIIFESAVAIHDGEVIDSELTAEAAKLRENVKEILDKITSEDGVEDDFRRVCSEEEKEVPEVPVRSNKMFYIAAGVGAAALILLFVLVGRVF